jgi:hypothetical protein
MLVEAKYKQDRFGPVSRTAHTFWLKAKKVVRSVKKEGN